MHPPRPDQDAAAFYNAGHDASMCGIAGRYNFLTQAPVDPECVSRMNLLLAHRGPDGAGVHVTGPVGLGHRRLAVIDLTEAAAQPMSDGDGLWVTFNGEIYNFRDLRADLTGRGHRFRSQSDTEVILAAYRQWGTACLHHVHGMFAFALWDAREQALFLARDRIGKKPLYYRIDRDGLAFASEPKAFLAEPSFEARPAPPALMHFLALQYVPSTMSAFQGVHRLPPAHFLLVTASGVRRERYWRLKYTPKRLLSDAEATDELRDRLSSATRARLISDVPLGAFLSGGLDSSTIVALMASQASGRVKTFSIGFESQAYNELGHARRVADRFGTEHQEFVVRPDAVAILPRLVWHYNEPFGDSSAIPTMYLAELTRQSVTVALTGDGGDESLAGYDRYRAVALAARMDRSPGGLARLPLVALGTLPAGPRWRWLTRAKRLAAVVAYPAAERYARLVMPFAPELLSELCTPAFHDAAEGANPTCTIASHFDATDAPDSVDAVLDVDVNSYLPDDLLVKVDIATMAVGLEARSPFLDTGVMEFAASLPSRMKLRGRVGKWLLRAMAAPLLPASTLTRRKQGFGVPLDEWFRGPLRDLATDVLFSDAARGRDYFHLSVIRRLLDEHARGVRLWHHQLWGLLVFELWHRTFIDRRPNSPSWSGPLS